MLGEVRELPYLPELPGRGFGADLIARTGALLVDFPVEWQPHGWTVTSSSGRDQARARDHLNRDLDALTEQAQGAALLKVSVCGPMTLGAALELPNLHKVLTDHGAFRDLAESLAEGTRSLLAELGSRLAGTAFVLQVDEPGLPQVLSRPGADPVRVRHRPVAAPVGGGPGAGRLLEVAPPGHRVVHCCAADVPYDLLAGSGASAVSVDAGLIADAHLDALGELVEAGISLWLGVFPGTDAEISAADARERIRRLWSKLGFDPNRLADAVVPTPSCGLAGASMPYARRVMSALNEVGASLRDGLD